jgi:hypothetical protein
LLTFRSLPDELLDGGGQGCLSKAMSFAHIGVTTILTMPSL